MTYGKVLRFTEQQIKEKREAFQSLDHLHNIKRDSEGNVCNAHELLETPCYHVDKIIGRQHMVIFIDNKKCAIVSKGYFTGFYDIHLFNFLCNVSFYGRTGKGYHEVWVDLDVVHGLAGVVPNIEELYLPLFKTMKTKKRRCTAFHRDAYVLMTGDFEMYGSNGLIIHHPLGDKRFRTYNVMENMVKMSRSDHIRLHKTLDLTK